tara:strand:+ start:553 stop:1239 length:687 start_codon:yes stop_codon:yes gene_type:complete
MFKILIASKNSSLIDDLKTNILDALREIQIELIIKTSASEALSYFNTKKTELTIVDVNLDDINGIEFFQRIHTKNTITTHKILLSNKYEDYIKAAAYDAGVDDFITDPITPAVFQKKIKQIFNRLKKDNGNGRLIHYNSLIIDKSKFLITYGDKKYILPRKQFLIFYLLCTNPGEVFTRDIIYKKVWEEEMPSNNRTVDVHIRQIRKIIPKNNVKTYRGIGYKVETIN